MLLEQQHSELIAVFSLSFNFKNSDVNWAALLIMTPACLSTFLKSPTLVVNFCVLVLEYNGFANLCSVTVSYMCILQVVIFGNQKMP